MTNLTDEEIVKALENCNNEITNMTRHSCDTCPYKDIEPCGKAQMTDCLDLIYRLQAENERLTKEKKTAWQKFKQKVDESIELSMLLDKRAREKAELQKQVDELTDKLGKVLSGIKADELLIARGVEQAVKDTAKEILAKAPTETDADERFIHWLRERYGVEVE